MDVLYDNYNRKIDYLRISVTDRCNLRCFYCMPEQGIIPKPHDEILSYEEIKRFAEAAVAAGITKIRLTGGEPLVRRDIVKLVQMLANIRGLSDLSLTTNGILLPHYAGDLKRAGLKRVNISIDSLDPAVYQKLTRLGDVEKARAGVKAALETGFHPVKINTVLIKGINDDPRDFVSLIHEYPVHVRFIEFMPVGDWSPGHYLSIDELEQKLGLYGTLEPVEGPEGAGPARYATYKGALGTLGFISPISNHFCPSCNRLRLTPDGKLRVCLFSDAEFDVRPVLRGTTSEQEIAAFIRTVTESKPERHSAGSQEKPARLMCQIGG